MTTLGHYYGPAPLNSELGITVKSEPRGAQSEKQPEPVKPEATKIP